LPAQPAADRTTRVRNYEANYHYLIISNLWKITKEKDINPSCELSIATIKNWLKVKLAAQE
jgi:hypothetical protein